MQTRSVEQLFNTEPIVIENSFSSWLLYHLASGHSFFVGITFLLVAAVLLPPKGHSSSRCIVFLALCGVLAIAVSSTPLPYGFYALMLAVGTVAFYSATNASFARKRLRRFARVAFIALCIAGIVFELPYHVEPMVDVRGVNSFAVIGDSITAGLGDGDKVEKWPSLVSEEAGFEFHDISRMGATVASALERIEIAPIDSDVILIELGGNDILGTTSPADFERDLDALLAMLRIPDRTLVMFELPLPPFYHEYGRIQRAAASRHGVTLIPKRVLLGVITTAGNTHDSIHLTQQGHEALADAVLRILSTSKMVDERL